MLAVKHLLILLFYIGFIYQFIELTIDYMKYEHLIEIGFEKSKFLPAMTFCLKREHLLNQNKKVFICKIIYKKLQII